jgi:hypothetical protein
MFLCKIAGHGVQRSSNKGIPPTFFHAWTLNPWLNAEKYWGKHNLLALKPTPQVNKIKEDYL